jgi:methionine synthase II (cobalamin-independent)
MSVSSDELVAMLEGGFDVLEGKGVDRNALARQSMVSPSCGLGSASVEIAERALALTREVSEKMRGRYP